MAKTLNHYSQQIRSLAPDAVAKRWDEEAFTQARNANPSLAIREADKVLAASSTRKKVKAEPEQRDPHAEAMSKLATIRWDLKLLSEMHLADQLAGDEIEAANQSLFDVFKALTTKFNPGTKQILDQQHSPHRSA